MAVNTGKINKYSISNKSMPTSKNTFVQKTQNITTLPKPEKSYSKSNTTSSKTTSGSKKYNTYVVTPKTTSTSNNSSALGSSSYTGGTGISAPKVEDYTIDLSDILASYTNAAEAQKQTIRDTTAASIKALQDSESSQRSTLSKALDRFREDTAKERQLQQSNFNANRADLEAQAYLANRQALQNAAARGLGGSGLQQLSQLQNLINQSTATNDLAQSNIESLNDLAEALARQEEDTTTSLNDLASNLASKIEELNKSQANQLNEIDKNSANLQEQLKYQEAVRAQDARTQAERFAANLAAQNASTSSNWALYNQQKNDELESANTQAAKGLEAALLLAENSMKNASQTKQGTGTSATRKNNQAVNEAYTNALNNIASIYGSSALDSTYLDNYNRALQQIFNKYYRS